MNGHARTLALLAPSLRSNGAAATREELVDLMAAMERRFPGNREQSLFASVELSLRRLSPDNRDRARVLGLFHGGVDLDVLRAMMDWEEADVVSLAGQLVETGLATPNPYKHLSLNPALGPYLRSTLDDAEREALTVRWVDRMRGYVAFLHEQQSQNAELAATLTVLELPNLFALLAHVSRTGNAEVTVDLAATLQRLLGNLGRPRLLAQVAETRDAAAARISVVWNHARFDAERSRIDEQLVAGRLRNALTGAQGLLERARNAGEQAYQDADYDLATAYFLLGRALEMTGSAQQALPHLDNAQRRFEAIAQARSVRVAAGMVSTCWAEKGDCLQALGRLDDAVAAYEESIRSAEQQGNERQLAVGKGQLGTVRMRQRRYRDALEAYAEAREHFAKLGEPGSVAAVWHQIGIVYRNANQPEAAEDAYCKSLAIEVQLGNVKGADLLRR